MDVRENLFILRCAPLLTKRTNKHVCATSGLPSTPSYALHNTTTVGWLPVPYYTPQVCQPLAHYRMAYYRAGARVTVVDLDQRKGVLPTAVLFLEKDFNGSVQDCDLAVVRIGWVNDEYKI